MLAAYVEITTYPAEGRSAWRIRVDGKVHGEAQHEDDEDGTTAFRAAMAWIRERGIELGGWTHRVVENTSDGQVTSAPTKRVTSSLCGAKRGWMSCVREVHHDGDHEAVDVQTGVSARWR